MLGWPKIYKLAHAFPWEYSYRRLQLAQLLGQLGVFLTWVSSTSTSTSASGGAVASQGCARASAAVGLRRGLGGPSVSRHSFVEGHASDMVLNLVGRKMWDRMFGIGAIIGYLATMVVVTPMIVTITSTA